MTRLRRPIAHPTPFGERRPKGDRALTAAQVEKLVKALQHGASPTVLAREFGVSVRTVHRWRRAEIHWVEVAGYRAAFSLRPPEHGVREGPVQLSAWFPVSA